MEERLLTIPEVARRLGISRSAAYLLAEHGELPIIRVSRGCVRVDPKDLEEFIARCRNRARDDAPTVLGSGRP